MSKKATFIKQMQGFRGDARLYELNPPLEGATHVVVSAVSSFMMEPETYIFRSDTEGEIQDWLEMEGSFRGGMDHQKALHNAGYEVV